MTTAVNLLPLPTPLEEPPPNPPSWEWGNGSGLDSGDDLYDDGYDEGSLILNGNLWNTDPTSTGTVTMTYDAGAGSLTTDVDFSNWIASSPSSGNPAGYPKLYFGYDGNGGTSPDLFTLPATVAAVAQQQSVELTTTYSVNLSQSPELPVDIAYDGFLTNGQDGPRELEMEIFLYTANMSFSNFETLTIPTWINGQLQNAQWGVFVAAGGTGGPLVGFDLMPSASGVPVGIYPADFLGHMSDAAILGQLQANHLGTFQASQVNGYTFDGLDLGSEFFPEDNSSQPNQAYYSYTISSYSMLQNPLSPSVTGQTANQTWIEGQALSFQLASNTFTDPQNETLTYSAILSSGAALPSWLSFNPSTRTFSGTVPATPESLTIKVSATDTSGLSTSETFTATIPAIAPTVSNQTANQTWTEGQTLSFQLASNTFTDPQGEALSFSASLSNGSSLPSWLSFSPSTEAFSGTVPVGPDNIPLKVTATDTSGLSTSETFTATVPAPAPPADFYNDGTSTIPIQNADGQIYLLQAAGAGGNVGNYRADWQMVGADNFYGDGNDDIVLQNTDGQIFLFDMNGSTVAGAGNVGNYGSDWGVVGSGGFFSDGDKGLALQNTDGQIFLFDMQGSTVAGYANVGNYGSDWHVAATGNFFGDGNDDLVLQETGGDIYLLDIHDTVAKAGNVGNFGADWRVVGAGSFFGDGNTDLVLQDTNGQIELLDMHGSTAVSMADVGNFGAAWQVKEVGDFFGDGHDGLALQNTSGQIYLMELNGGSVTHSANLGNYGSSWHIPLLPG